MAKPAKVIILGDAADAAKAFKQIRDEADKSESKLKKTAAQMNKVGKGLTIGVTAPIVLAATQAVQALGRIEKIGAQTEAVIKSTGGAAGVTRDDIDELAGSLESLTSVEAESITEGQNLLLTFKNIRNEAGEGNDIFDQSTRALVDMSVAMGTEPKAAAIQLGKALNDPTKGIAALTRVGITFSEEQENLIRSLQASGDVMGAQKIILAELESQFGGSGEALGETFPGQIAKMGHAWGTFTEGIMMEVMPALSSVVEGATGILDGFADLGDGTKQLIIGFGGVAAAAGPLLIVTSKLITAVNTLKTSNISLGKALGSPLTGPLIIATGLAIGIGAVIKENTDRTNAWRDALEGGAGAIEEFADEMLAAEIVSRDLDGAMEANGVTAGDLKEAILGDDEAFQDFIGTLSGPGRRELLSLVESQRMAREKADEHKQAIDEQKGALEDLSGKMPIFGGAMQGYTQATGDATDATEDLDDATQNLADTQLAAINPLFNLSEKTLAAKDAQANYNDAVSEFGERSPQARDAGMELATATLELEAAAAKYAAEGGPDSVEALRDALEIAGLSKAEIDQLIESIKKLNNTPVTNFFTGSGEEQRGHGGGRAHGGPVQADRAYVVGEKGPELFLPNVNGTIVPAASPKEMAGFPAAATNGSGGGLTVQFIGPVYGFDDFERKVVEAVIRADRRGTNLPRTA